jgi:hypothetical protein
VKIQQLKQENFNLKQSIGEIPKINSKLDDLEQHSRKSCVRISGVPESVHVILSLLSALSVMKIFPSRTEVDLICFCFTACLAR